jgi:DNA modification methylase
MIHDGNSLEVLKQFDENSIDACVCDPPYELGFMGKSWDSTGIAYNVDLWREVLRVLKPGGHLLAFGGSRTFHRLACAIEDAGFEIRDQLLWIYGSGFPKSLDVSKAIDKSEGIWRGRSNGVVSQNGAMENPNYQRTPKEPPATPAAIQWNGWGTALKPAHEPICMARKPFKSTVADNVLQWGTGAINVDAGRIGNEQRFNPPTHKKETAALGDFSMCNGTGTQASGRWPSNVLLSETAAQDLDDSNGMNFSRFFYVAKASKREREAGLEGFEVVKSCMSNGGKSENAKATQDIGLNRAIARQNNHPTVKPIKLMEYLVKLVTPPGGTVLDPFTGSGSTGCACARRLGFEFQGIELSPQYAAIAEARINWFAMNELDLDELDRSENAKADTQGKLF